MCKYSDTVIGHELDGDAERIAHRTNEEIASEP
jgi:hypothetical protein